MRTIRFIPKDLHSVSTPLLSFRRHLQCTWSSALFSTKHSSRNTVARTQISDPDHPFYNYTSGRWLYNEQLRLSERRCYFNIHELCQVVAESVGQSADNITIFTKVAEGGSYRIFEATFQDGMKVIVRLPYPSTLPQKYGIASEVATMEYLRLHGIPIPKVLDWSCSMTNQVGSEYIIMEKVPGTELQDTWYTMTVKERMDMVEKVVNIEKILFAIRFPANGSLYFKDFLDNSITTIDVPSDVNCEKTSRFCIGPSTELLWWYRGRGDLVVNRGPWKNTEEVLEAVGQREKSWLHRFGERRFPREPLYRELYGGQKVDPQVQIDNLSNYLKVTPYIVPEREELNRPTIRHPDLSPNNLLISASGEITGLIDWQHSTILPAFLQAKIPKYFQNYGDEDSENFISPKLPENFDTLSDKEKEWQKEIYRRRQLHYFYLGFTNHNNLPHFRAMGTYDLVVRNRLYDTAARPWEGDHISLKAELVRASTYWPKIATSAMRTSEYPIKYSEAEVKECLEIDSEQKTADAQMQRVRDFIGINIDGWVSNECYDEAREKERLVKEQMVEDAETEEEKKELIELWPFQDHDELD